MKLEWMGEYRLLLEKLIHYCNVYSAASKKKLPPMEGVTFTFSQIQVVEYLIENEETTQNMSTIANRLGITFSTFSKVVNKLEEKGLLEKFYMEGNKKNIVIRVSGLGHRVYRAYVDYILQKHFNQMFEDLKDIPAEYLEAFARALSNPLELDAETAAEEAQPVLIPCKAYDRKAE